MKVSLKRRSIEYWEKGFEVYDEKGDYKRENLVFLNDFIFLGISLLYCRLLKEFINEILYCWYEFLRIV